MPECRAFLADCLRLASFLPARCHARASAVFPTDGPPPDLAQGTLRRLLDTSLLLVLTTLTGFLLMELISPFGLADAAQARSQQISARLLAPFYRSKAQDRIAVVLIDDQTLEYRQVGWPPQYVYYSDAIRRVLEHRPAAVFLDVMVEHPRPYDDSLASAREDLRMLADQSGIPVFLAVSSPGRQSLLGSVGEDGQEGLYSAVTSWRNLGSGYPLWLDGDTGKDGQVFDLAQGLGDGAIAAAVASRVLPDKEPLALGRKADVRSPGWLLYEVVCTVAGPDCREAANDTRAILGKDVQAVAMHVRWNMAPPVLAPPQQTGIAGGECIRIKTATRIEQITWMVEQAGHSLLSGMFNGLDEELRPLCPPFLVIGEEQLDVVPLPGDPELEGYPSLLEGRAVLIGTRLQGAHDLIDTPVQARMPGVLLHAMALDNLMLWGSRISDVPSKALHMSMQLLVGGLLALLFSGFRVHARALQIGMAKVSRYGLLVCGLVLLCWAAFFDGWSESGWMRWLMGGAALLLLVMSVMQWRWEFRWWVAMPFVVASVVACLASLVIVVWLRMPPPDWLGLLALASGMFFLMHNREQIREDRRRNGSETKDAAGASRGGTGRSRG